MTVRARMVRLGNGFVRILQILFIGYAFYSSDALSDAGSLMAPRSWHLPVVIVLLALLVWLATLFHELGHATAARLIGRRLHLIMVWPFWYFPKAERLVFSFRQGPRVDGMVIATPDLWGDWRRGEATYLLGGIYANLLTGLIARAAVATNIFGPLAEAILMSFFVVSMVFAVVNLMPVWFADRRRSDGARLVDKWRVRQERQTEHTGWLSAMQADGISPEDWNADLVGKVEADVAAGRADNQAYGLLYQRYMEFSDFPRARALINRRASLPGDAPDWLRVAQSFFIAYLDKNGTEAERLLNGVRSKSRASYFYWRAWAATRVARGDRRGALAAVRRARSFGNRNLVGMYRGEATILDEIERTAQALAADPPKRWIRIRWPGRPERL